MQAQARGVGGRVEHIRVACVRCGRAWRIAAAKRAVGPRRRETRFLRDGRTGLTCPRRVKISKREFSSIDSTSPENEPFKRSVYLVFGRTGTSSKRTAVSSITIALAPSIGAIRICSAETRRQDSRRFAAGETAVVRRCGEQRGSRNDPGKCQRAVSWRAVQCRPIRRRSGSCGSREDGPDTTSGPLSLPRD